MGPGDGVVDAAAGATMKEPSETIPPGGTCVSDLVDIARRLAEAIAKTTGRGSEVHREACQLVVSIAMLGYSPPERWTHFTPDPE